MFGLGAVLCEILTGKPPYVAEEASEVHRLAVRGDLDGAYGRLDACGADTELVALTKLCLAPDRRRRPADAGVLGKQVSEYLNGVERRLRQVEIERAEAQVRAAGERRARTLTLALSISLVGLVLLGGAWLWRGHTRAMQLAADIRQSLAEASVGAQRAEALGGVGPWLEALAALNRVEGQLPDAPLDLQRQAAQLREQLVGGREAAESAAAVALDEAQLLDELSNLHAQDAPDQPPRAVHQLVPPILRKRGWDFQSQPISSMLESIRHRSPEVIHRVSAALDYWAHDLYSNVPADKLPATGFKEIVEAARLLDPDPWRVQLRQAAFHEDPVRRREQLVSLVQAAQPGTLPVHDALRLGISLSYAGEDAAAIEWLQRVQSVYPDSSEVNDWLARLLGASNPSRDADATPYRYTAWGRDARWVSGQLLAWNLLRLLPGRRLLQECVHHGPSDRARRADWATL